MSSQVIPPTVISFGPFQVDFRTQELKKQGIRVRLPGQSFQILEMLLKRPGELVTREELQQALWPSDTHVDFERGVNAAVNRLREVLGDSADHPHLIETLPRRGYRFIGTVNQPQVPSAVAAPAQEFPPARENQLARSRVTAFKILTAVFVAVAILVVAALYRRPPRNPNTVALTPLPFTALQGLEINPTFSPDGSQIAFAWNGDPAGGGQGFDLYVKVVGSEELLRLTRRPSQNISPAWSPDGTQIAFHRIDSASGQTGIYLIPALGGSERRLRATTAPSRVSASISWSPDGKRLAFVDSSPSGEDSRAYLLSLDTLEAKPIPHLSECRSEWRPAFSHDGQQLAYLCWRGQQEFALYSLNLSSGAPRLVKVFYAWPYGMTWSTDDKSIILSKSLATSGELVEISVEDGTFHTLPFGENSRSPAIAPRGGRLAYELFSTNINIWRSDLQHRDLPATNLISSSREHRSAQYSPDGKHIAFESTRTGSREIWMSDSDGTHLVQLTRFNNPQTGSAQWSPDGQKIAFDTRAFGHPEIYLLDISERVPHKLSCNLQDMSMPSWSHDGKWIYFTGKPQFVYRCPSTGGDAVVLSLQSQAHGALESPDGQKVFFSTFVPNSTVYEVSLQHPGRESAVPEMPVLADASLWVPAPEGIYFVPKDAPHSIRYYDFSTRKTRPVLTVEKDLYDGLSVSPDGRWVIYAQIDQINIDIMLVDNFQ